MEYYTAVKTGRSSTRGCEPVQCTRAHVRWWESTAQGVWGFRGDKAPTHLAQSLTQQECCKCQQLLQGGLRASFQL